MKKTLMCLLFVLALCGLHTTCAADVCELRVYLYRDYTDCVFYIRWTNSEQAAAVCLTAPDGSVTEADAHNSVSALGQLEVSVGFAASGYWTVSLEGESLGTVSVGGGERKQSAAAPLIRGFTAEQHNGQLQFMWETAATQDTISASVKAVGGTSAKEWLLWNGYDAHRADTVSVPVTELQTGLYFFLLEIFDGQSHAALRTAEPLYVEYPDAPERVVGVRTGSVDGVGYLRWDAAYGAHYEVTVYDADTLEVLRSLRTSEGVYMPEFSDGSGQLLLSVAAVENGITGAFDLYRLEPVEPVGSICFPDAAVTKTGSMIATVTCPEDVTASFYLDGILLLEGASTGNYDLKLSEGKHTILACLCDALGNARSVEKKIEVDHTPPPIRLHGAEHPATESDSFLVEGHTEPGAIVTVNGVEQCLHNGSFAATVPLSRGENQIIVRAYDAAGNQSMHSLIVERQGLNGRRLLRYAIPALAFLLLSAWTIWLNRKPRQPSTQPVAEAASDSQEVSEQAAALTTGADVEGDEAQ